MKIGSGLAMFKAPEGTFTLGYVDLRLRRCDTTTVDAYPSAAVLPLSDSPALAVAVSSGSCSTPAAQLRTDDCAVVADVLYPGDSPVVAAEQPGDNDNDDDDDGHQ